MKSRNDKQDLIIREDIGNRRGINFSRRLIVVSVIVIVALYQALFAGREVRSNFLPTSSGVDLIPWGGPKKIVSKVHTTQIVLGQGHGDLQSEVTLEHGDVEYLTVHIHAVVSQREKVSDDDLPVLQFRVDFFSEVQIIRFQVAEERLDDHARVKLRIAIPSQNPNNLIINGTFVSIQSNSLDKAHIQNLRLESERGDIKLDNINRISNLKINVAQHGNIYFQMAKGSGSANLDDHISTFTGDIHMDKLALGHRKDLKDSFSQEHTAILTDYDKDSHKKISIEAFTHSGAICGHIDVGDRRLIYLDAGSVNSDVVINLSDMYSGRFSVGTIDGQTSIRDKPNSKDIVTFQRFDREEKRGKKYSCGEQENLVNSQIKIMSHKGSTAIEFF